MDLRIASYGVIVREQRVLLAHWVGIGRGGAWTLPGGGIDPGEHPADAAVREIREETGYAARLTDLLGIDSIVIPAADRAPGAERDVQAIRIVYTAEIIGGELANEIDGSSDQAAWFDIDDVGTLDRTPIVDAALGYWFSRQSLAPRGPGILGAPPRRPELPPGAEHA